MARIEVLADGVARRIAAGEVVERPASVVKELVENALDAGAGRVTIEIEEGGRKRIAVADDGEGLAAAEVALAFEPHATSKIRSEADLEHVATLGFRGEALPSIAAVAEVELWTRRQEEPAGTRYHRRAEELLAVEAAGAPVGCRIEVRDLFFNVPARRKFLKSAATEAGHVAELVGRLALARPAVGFTLVQDGRERLLLPPSDLRARVRRLLGREIDAALRAVAGGDAVRVEGFVSHSHFSLAHGRSIHFFVNGRWVRDRVLLGALAAAFSSWLPRGRFPAGVIFLSLPPEAVDVNVHPAKLEVRFRDAPAVHEAIRRTLRGSMAEEAPPAGAAESEAVYPDALTRRSVPRDGDDSTLSSASAGGTLVGQVRLRLVPAGAAAESAAPLFRAEATFADLRVIGQAFDGYLICERGADLMLIDQHAAHERVAFERLRAERRTGRVESQALLVPQPVELGPGQAEHLLAAAEELEGLGLDLEVFGASAVLVRSVPALFGTRDVASLLAALASDLAEEGGARAVEERVERVLATIACHSVVRVGQKLSETEIRGLLAAMDATDLNANCPHGRPVATRLPRAEIERRFGR